MKRRKFIQISSVASAGMTFPSDNPPAPADKTVMEKFSKIGISPGVTFTLDVVDPEGYKKRIAGERKKFELSSTGNWQYRLSRNS